MLSVFTFTSLQMIAAQARGFVDHSCSVLGESLTRDGLPDLVGDARLTSSSSNVRRPRRYLHERESGYGRGN
jgi:hypothetical protein